MRTSCKALLFSSLSEENVQLVWGVVAVTVALFRAAIIMDDLLHRHNASAHTKAIFPITCQKNLHA